MRKHKEKTIVKWVPKVIPNYLKIEPWALKGLIFLKMLVVYEGYSCFSAFSIGKMLAEKSRFAVRWAGQVPEAKGQAEGAGSVEALEFVVN